MDFVFCSVKWDFVWEEMERLVLKVRGFVGLFHWKEDLG